ncbi:MAG: M23 family metallopeptidase [Magnetococcus sp. DMHC-8]
MILVVIVCLLLTGMTSPLLADAIQTTSQQLRLAEPARLVYGLEGGSVQKRKTQRKWHAASTDRRQSARRAGHKKGNTVVRPGSGQAVAGESSTNRSAVRPPAKGVQRGAAPVRQAQATRGVHKKKSAVAGQKSVARLRHRQGAGKHHMAKQVHRKGGLFSAAVERRMGTFTEPVHGTAASRSSGLFFRVPENANVLAASRGQVVYAGWFRGYGLLAIVNHGGRVYSLYGHNRDLLVTKGDFVEPGQIIAKSGKTGSVDGVSGLYFEIRRGNKPENPRRWLAKNSAHGEKPVNLM